MICNNEKFMELGDNFEDSTDTNLWNYFADGVCLKRCWEYGSWKSNSIDGNVVFIPSNEYYDIYESENGYIIECDKDDHG